jgi:hypothetical protein
MEGQNKKKKAVWEKQSQKSRGHSQENFERAKGRVR